MQTEAQRLQPEQQRGVYLLRLSASVPEEVAVEFLSKLHYVSEFLKGFQLTGARDAVRFEAHERYQEFFSPSVVLPLMLHTYGRLSGNGHRVTQASGNGYIHPWALDQH